jgi:hypothetical protein
MRASEIERMVGKRKRQRQRQECSSKAGSGSDGLCELSERPNNPQILSFPQPTEYIVTTIDVALPRMPSDSLIPGQPVPLPRGPALQLGSGIYSKNGQIRASLVGTPLYHGSVGLSSLCTWFDLNDLFRSPRLLECNNISCKTSSTGTEFRCVRFYHPAVPSAGSSFHHGCG